MITEVWLKDKLDFKILPWNVVFPNCRIPAEQQSETHDLIGWNATIIRHYSNTLATGRVDYTNEKLNVSFIK